MSSEVIRGHQRSSEVIRGHQRSSEVIGGHQRSSQRSSEVIGGHQRSSEAIRGHQRSSEVISGDAPLVVAMKPDHAALARDDAIELAGGLRARDAELIRLDSQADG